jgi:hypothetical protein
MTARTARWWIVLGALAVVLAATLDGSPLALAAGGLLCVALCLAVVALDSQRKYRRTRR